jgi:lipid A 3-O-deacylase
MVSLAGSNILPKMRRGNGRGSAVKVGSIASRATLAALLGLLLLGVRPAAAQINLGPVTVGSPADPAHFALGAGAFDALPDSRHKDSHTAGEFRGEYRFGDVLSIFSPFVGASVTTLGGTYVYAGFGFDINIGPSWVLNPNFAVGNYGPGSGTKLGSSIEFRSGLEIDYRMWDQSRLGLAIQHMSNAGISQHNPGEESVTLIYAIPLPGWP